MNKYIVALVLAAAFVAPTAAQPASSSVSQTSVNTKPGLIPPSVPVAWGLERTYDSFTKTPGQIAQERAAEALEMQRQNNTVAEQKAVNATKQAADEASNKDVKGLDNALKVLKSVRSRTKGKAKGLDNAIQAVSRAKYRHHGRKPMNHNFFGPNATKAGKPHGHSNRVHALGR